MIIAGTGHRPDKLKTIYRVPDIGGQMRIVDGPNIYETMVDLLMPALHGVATHVIAGMALGWDLALAIAAKRLGIPWTAAVPFRGHEAPWRPKQIASYREIIASAAYVFEICPPGFAAWKYQRRNEWMVDRCDLVLACWDGSDGGTANCLRYANGKRPIVNAWPELCELGAYLIPF